MFNLMWFATDKLITNYKIWKINCKIVLTFNQFLNDAHICMNYIFGFESPHIYIIYMSLQPFLFWFCLEIPLIQKVKGQNNISRGILNAFSSKKKKKSITDWEQWKTKTCVREIGERHTENIFLNYLFYLFLALL